MESEEIKQKNEQTTEKKDSLNSAPSNGSNPLIDEEELNAEEQDLDQESIEDIKEYADKIEQEAQAISNNNFKKRKSKIWRIFKILLFIAVIYYIWIFIKGFQQREVFYSIIHDIPLIGKYFSSEDNTGFASSSVSETSNGDFSPQKRETDKYVAAKMEENLPTPKQTFIQNGFADLVGDANQSVVSITTRGYVSSDKSITQDGNIDSLYAFFIDGYRNKKYRGLGSGFVISQDGYIVTNYHVVRDVESIMVHFLDGKFYNTRLDSYDEISDIALLKAEGVFDMPALKFGDSAKVRAGDWVLAVGNPFGLGFSVSFGVISAKDRFISRSFVKFLQTDAAINRGNSGGPMINMLGEVIGINTAMASNNGGSVGVGFAIPSNQASYIISQLKEHGRVLRGWLGVKVTIIGMEDNIVGEILKKGVLVYQVLPNSPASSAGFQKGDIIYKLNDVDVDDIASFASVLMSSNINDSMKVYYVRDGQKMTANVILGEKKKGRESSKSKSLTQKRENSKVNIDAPKYVANQGIKIKENNDINKPQQDIVETSIQGKHFEGMGIEFAELKGDYIKNFGFNEESTGVVIVAIVEREHLNPNLRPGLLLRKVNNLPVEDIDSLEKVVANMKEKEDIIFLLEDNKGNKFFISKQNKKYI